MKKYLVGWQVEPVETGVRARQPAVLAYLQVICVLEKYFS